MNTTASNSFVEAKITHSETQLCRRLKHEIARCELWLLICWSDIFAGLYDRSADDQRVIVGDHLTNVGFDGSAGKEAGSGRSLWYFPLPWNFTESSVFMDRSSLRCNGMRSVAFWMFCGRALPLFESIRNRFVGRAKARHHLRGGGGVAEIRQEDWPFNTFNV